MACFSSYCIVGTMRLKQTKQKVNTTNLVDCLQQAGMVDQIPGTKKIENQMIEYWTKGPNK